MTLRDHPILDRSSSAVSEADVGSGIAALCAQAEQARAHLQPTGALA